MNFFWVDFQTRILSTLWLAHIDLKVNGRFKMSDRTMDFTKPWLTTHTRNTLITKDYHLFLFSYIKEKTKNFFDVVWYDIQRAAHIYQIKFPVQLLSKIKSTTTLPKRLFKGNSFYSTKWHLFSSLWLIEHQRTS